MTNKTTSQIQCSACGQPMQVDVYSFIDVTKDPQAKALLLNGRLNTAVCPNCSTPNTVATPLLYHDPTKELLIAHVPMEMNMRQDEQERAIGQLMNQMPKDNFKGYMFNPRRAITIQGLMEQILEADGITREMIEEQRKRAELAQQFIEARSQEDLEAMIVENDARIDETFFQTLTSMAQHVLEEGRQDIAQHILAIQQLVLQNSSYGQTLLEQQQVQQAVIEEVADAIDAMGEGAGRADFLDLAVEYKDQDDHLQALVGMVRPVFDYEFFQMMTTRIGAAPAADREELEALRARLVELTTMIDQQHQAAMQRAAGLLRALVNAQDVASIVAENLPMIDDLFMQVLQVNIQQAEQQKNIQLLTRLKEVQQVVYSYIQDQMQPELRFVNELLGMDDDAASAAIQARAAEFGPELLEVLDAVEQLVRQQGGGEMAERVQRLKSVASGVLAG